MDSPVTTAIGWTSLTKVAKRIGVQPAAVSHAARSGRLTPACVRRDPETGRVSAVHMEIALREWEENADRTDSPQRMPSAAAVASVAAQPEDWWEAPGDKPIGEAPPEGTLADAAARAKHWTAMLAELKFREAAKELMRTADVDAERAADYTEIRTKVLGVVPQARQQMPHVSEEDFALWEKLLRVALEALGGAGELP